MINGRLLLRERRSAEIQTKALGNERLITMAPRQSGAIQRKGALYDD
jgi:hypothetical protein